MKCGVGIDISWSRVGGVGGDYVEEEKIWRKVWKKGGWSGIASGIVESVEMQSNLRLELCPRPLSPSIRPLSAIIILTEEER